MVGMIAPRLLQSQRFCLGILECAGARTELGHVNFLGLRVAILGEGGFWKRWFKKVNIPRTVPNLHFKMHICCPHHILRKSLESPILNLALFHSRRALINTPGSPFLGYPPPQLT